MTEHKIMSEQDLIDWLGRHSIFYGEMSVVRSHLLNELFTGMRLAPAESAEAEDSLARAGVFKGAEGLRQFAECSEFWDGQPYGTRLYFDGNHYLHRDVVRAAIRALQSHPAAKVSAVPEGMVVVPRDVAIRLYEKLDAWDDSGGEIGILVDAIEGALTTTEGGTHGSR